MWAQLALFLLLWIGVATVPYGMYLVAWVFESRPPGRGVPIWRGQSKAFVPGDLGLSLAAAVGIWLAVRQGWPGWALTWWWLALGAAASATALYVGRRVLYSKDDYTYRQWNSPSKRYHDVVMFGVFPALAFVFVLPVYLQPWGGIGLTLRVIGLLGIALWLVGVAWDATHHEVPNPNQHPDRWRSLWDNSEIRIY